MIDLTVNEAVLERTVARARERGIVIPTLAQMRHPERIPDAIIDRLRSVGLWDIDPMNLFRVTWKNEPVSKGGLFGPVNALEVPSALSGVPARIIALAGKWFPTGAHKVGAAFGCLAPRLVTGQFDPTRQKAVWPSTGNYCRGGAYDAAILGCESVAILPEEMSQERFEWLKNVAGEIIATPGCESNVKEIFDKCNEIRATRGDDVVIFNQFDEFGNHLWHYALTGPALEEAFLDAAGGEARMAGFVSQTGSAGTIGAGDYLKERFPGLKIGASEALQCPTLLMNGYGGHRIEGIGDKHVPWVHNVRNTDAAIAIDDDSCMHLIRLFNEPVGRDYLLRQGVPQTFLDQLDLLGISSVGNLLSAVKMAKHFELTSKDVVLTIFTDSMELYGTRLEEMREQFGPYTETNAAADFHRHLLGQGTDNMLELRHQDKKRIHNLKYFTWVEQQGKTVEELDAQWYDFPDYWSNIHGQAEEIDRLIEAFNERTGALRDL